MSASYPLQTAIRVRTYELDSFGHVNNAEYLHYLEEARSEFLLQMGLSFHDFAAHHVQLVIVEASLRFVSPARYGDEIVIRGRCRDVRPASAWIDYVLTDRATGRVVATAETKGAFIDAATSKPCRAPEPFRTAFGAYTGAESG
ncbi:MAG: acyl-CoA thioesterase [Akkermansiaceae bacterium]|nr:acyl-CoA thioesterase [Armatimonadota bacterium]